MTLLFADDDKLSSNVIVNNASVFIQRSFDR